MSEAALQAQIIELAQTLHWTVGHHHDSRREVRPGVFVGDKLAAGIPDLVLVRERVLWVELKDTKGKLSANQVLWLDALRKAGAEVYVWRPGDMDEITSVLQSKCAPWELKPGWIPESLWQLQEKAA